MVLTAEAADTLRVVRRVLLITSACDGEDVGEAWVGYQWVSRLASRHDVTLLTMHLRDRTPPSQQFPARASSSGPTQGCSHGKIGSTAC